MTVPYSLLIIKPLTVGRGEAPSVLHNILEDCPVTLRKFRMWDICETTLYALTQPVGSHLSTLNFAHESVHLSRHIPSWMCIFTHLDRTTDPTDLLNTYCGPVDSEGWLMTHLRHSLGGATRFGGKAHPSDTVVHIASRERTLYESNLLFLNFKEETI